MSTRELAIVRLLNVRGTGGSLALRESAPLAVARPDVVGHYLDRVAQPALVQRGAVRPGRGQPVGVDAVYAGDRLGHRPHQPLTVACGQSVELDPGHVRGEPADLPPV